MPPSQFERFGFSSAALPAAQRLGVVREIIGREMGLDIDVFPDQPIHAAFDFLNVGRLQTFDGETLAIGRRTPRMMADGSDLVGMALGTHGNFFLSQRGRESVVTSRAGAAISWSDALTVRSGGAGQNGSMGVLIERSALAALVPNLEDTFGRLIPDGSEPLKLLVQYVRALRGISGLENSALASAVMRHIVDLAALAIGAGRDATVLAAGRGLRAARLITIKNHIAENLGRHDFSVGTVAAHHHLTPRYVQRLFEAEGTTFSQYLQEQRLLQAHRLLAAVAPPRKTINVISYECGFGEVTYFNRVFRRHFGATPSEIRRDLHKSDKDLT